MQASAAHSVPPTPMLILSSYLHVQVSVMVFFPSSFPSRTLYAFLISPVQPHLTLHPAPGRNTAATHHTWRRHLSSQRMRMYDVLFTRHSLSSYAVLNYLIFSYSISKQLYSRNLLFPWATHWLQPGWIHGKYLKTFQHPC